MKRALVFLGCLLIAACNRLPKDQQEVEPPPQAVLYGVRMTLFSGDALSSSSRAARLIWHRPATEFSADEVLMQTYKQGQAQMQVRATEVHGNMETQIASGKNVTFRTSDGMAGRTTRADFDAKEMKLRGPESIQLQGPGYFMNARTFEFDVKNKEAIFGGPVESQIGGAP